jgi:hypothetical protein
MVHEPGKDLAHVSDQPLLTGNECDAIVKSAGKRAAEHGWGSRYTYETSSHEVGSQQAATFRLLRSRFDSSFFFFDVPA